jgi:molecular chaperone DnaK
MERRRKELTMSDLIVGIDLGTTNSEVAAFNAGKVQVLELGQSKLLPSVVGLSPSGELLVGEAARNQLVLYPERTVRSIKRKMGSSETVSLGERQFRPPEISALILRELATWAGRALQQTIEKAVITVPAYFSDATAGHARSGPTGRPRGRAHPERTDGGQFGLWRRQPAQRHGL